MALIWFDRLTDDHDPAVFTAHLSWIQFGKPAHDDTNSINACVAGTKTNREYSVNPVHVVIYVPP